LPIDPTKMAASRRPDVADPDAGQRSRVHPAAGWQRRHTHHHIVLEAKPEGSVGGFDASAGWIRRDDIPTFRFRRGQRPFEGAAGRNIQQQRHDVGIRLLLFRGNLGTAVVGGVDRAVAQLEDRQQRRRLGGIGGDVVNRRQSRRFPGECTH
jgi:hypothetical protein